MKKQFYTLLACLSIVFLVPAQDASAQIKKGDVLLGGNVSFYRAKDDATDAGGSQTNINVFPSFGKAVKDNLVVGLTGVYLQYHWTSNSSSPKSDNKTQSYGGGVFIRRYQYLGSGFSAFIQGDLNYLYTKQELRNPPGSNSSNLSINSINAGFDPGIAYAISKRVQVETGFQNLVYANYSHSKSSYFDSSTPAVQPGLKSHAYSLGTNLSSALQNFIVGFRVLI